MSQQVNLYQPIFRKQKIIFSARTIGLSSAIILVALLLWSLALHQRIGTLETEHARQQAAEQRAIEQLTQLQRAAPPPVDSEQLQARIDSLNQRRIELRASLQSLDQRQPVRETRLPARLDALSRQVPEGLWLTRLTLQEPEQQVAVEGRALSSRLIPIYVSGLSSEAALRGTGFRQVSVRQAEDDIPGVSFLLRTAEDSDP